MTNINCANMSEKDMHPASRKSDERIVCKECNASVLRYKHIERHVSIHLKRDFHVDLFQCVYCEQTTTRNDKMAEHVKKTHRGEKQVYDDLLSDPQTITLFEKAGRQCFGDDFKNVKLPINHSAKEKDQSETQEKTKPTKKVIARKSDTKIIIKRRHLSLPTEEKCPAEPIKLKKALKTDQAATSTDGKRLIKPTMKMARKSEHSVASSVSSSKKPKRRSLDVRKKPAVPFQIRTRSKKIIPVTSNSSESSDKISDNQASASFSDDSALDKSESGAINSTPSPKTDDAVAAELATTTTSDSAVVIVATENIFNLETELIEPVKMDENTVIIKEIPLSLESDNKIVSETNDHIAALPKASSHNDSVILSENTPMESKELNVERNTSPPPIAKKTRSCQITVVISSEFAETVCEQIQVISEEEPVEESIIVDDILNDFNSIPLIRTRTSRSRRQRAKKSFAYLAAKTEENTTTNDTNVPVTIVNDSVDHVKTFGAVLV